MQVDIKIDGDAVQKSVVDAVVASSIGAEIQKAITKSLGDEQQGSHFNRQPSLVQSAVNEVIRAVVYQIVREEIDKKSEDIRAQVSEKLTPEVVLKISGVAVDVMLKRLDDNR